MSAPSPSACVARQTDDRPGGLAGCQDIIAVGHSPNPIGSGTEIEAQHPGRVEREQVTPLVLAEKRGDRAGVDGNRLGRHIGQRAAARRIAIGAAVSGAPARAYGWVVVRWKFYCRSMEINLSPSACEGELLDWRFRHTLRASQVLPVFAVSQCRVFNFRRPRAGSLILHVGTKWPFCAAPRLVPRTPAIPPGSCHSANGRSPPRGGRRRARRLSLSRRR
jgi:hypothetical protein